MKRFHVYLRADLHVEVQALTAEVARSAALKATSRGLISVTATKPHIEVVDVCDKEFHSLELK